MKHSALGPGGFIPVIPWGRLPPPPHTHTPMCSCDSKLPGRADPQGPEGPSPWSFLFLSVPRLPALADFDEPQRSTLVMLGVLTIAVRVYHDRWGYGVYSGPIGSAVLIIAAKWVRAPPRPRDLGLLPKPKHRALRASWPCPPPRFLTLSLLWVHRHPAPHPQALGKPLPPAHKGLVSRADMGVVSKWDSSRTEDQGLGGLRGLPGRRANKEWYGIRWAQPASVFNTKVPSWL